ncbi:hypothetical protein MAR_022291 [Mya arenaria]|uniref:Uncharacterized protein n=1 Tax=Mya arenaria TaxID=6604 RepID=A0ABY7DPB2_MYAAR|nr:hypothetical protein MAR_022291 [Mya arenaria]
MENLRIPRHSGTKGNSPITCDSDGAHFRKGRRETFRDNLSTASTDGQTSRYSFKIPRPFSAGNGHRDYDSTQISYPNSVFDNNVETSTSQPRPDVVNVGTLERDVKCSRKESDTCQYDDT